MTKRERISTRERVAIFEAAKGLCHICGVRIQAGERWDVEHPIQLAMGGTDDASNRRPAHIKCHKAKTQADATKLAKAKRIEAAHIGAKAPSRNPLPCGRRSQWRKKISGEVVRR